MNRTTFLAATASALALTAFPRAARAAQSDITLHMATGSIFGTLTMPSSAPPYPVVLIIAGSGPVDRNGNSGTQLQSDAYKLLAEALANDGIASVRYDKRGVGASAFTAPVLHATFDTMVGDAVAWVQMLSADKRFSSVTIAGHSEGALIGTVAAERTPVHALVLLDGAGRPAPVVLREQLRPKLSPELYAKADALIAELQAGHVVAGLPPELNGLFPPPVQPYVISWFKYDPAAELAKVHVPVTIVQGTADIQVTMTDARALKAASPNAKLVVVEGMNHVLKHFPDTSSLQAAMKGYHDPSLPLEPKVVAAVEEAVK